MPTSKYSVGPGKLTIGDTGLDLTCQVKSATVEWDEDAGDTEYTLCEDPIVAEAEYTASLSATIIQDLSSGGVIDFTWKNKGKTYPIVYIPKTSEGAVIEGKVRITPISVGGEARQRAESDVTWQFVDEPTFTPKSRTTAGISDNPAGDDNVSDDPGGESNEA